MRVVVQRVDGATVRVDDRVVSKIGKGIVVFLGIEKGDSEKDADYLLDKVITLRIFEDSDGKMNLSLFDVSAEMLVISQFTLLADCRKGRRPSFIRAENPEHAKTLYDYFISRGRIALERVEGGEFQAMMNIVMVNDGPVTMLLDSRKVF
jgi:D-tyrosyl-tRNA(Tyr) deacylase